MRVVVSSDSDSIEGNVDARFGRCKFFLAIDIDNGEIKKVTPIINRGAMQMRGAGTVAVSQVASLKPDAIISGNLGPKAADALARFNIKVYEAQGSIRNAIKRFLQKKLSNLGQASQISTIEQTAYETPSISDSQKKESSDEIFLVPLLSNNGLDSEISPHFGHAPFFGVYNKNTGELSVFENNLDHYDRQKAPVDQILEKVRPTTVVVIGIGNRAIELFKEKGVSIKTGNFRTMKELINNIENLEELREGCGH